MTVFFHQTFLGRRAEKNYLLLLYCTTKSLKRQKKKPTKKFGKTLKAAVDSAVD